MLLYISGASIEEGVEMELCRRVSIHLDRAGRIAYSLTLPHLVPRNYHRAAAGWCCREICQKKKAPVILLYLLYGCSFNKSIKIRYFDEGH